MKIAFIVPKIMHYRISFFEKLYAEYGTDFKVFASESKNESSRPHFSGEVTFPKCILTESKSRILTLEVVHISGLFKTVKNFNPDIVIIVNHVGRLDYIQTVLWAKKEKKKVIMWTCFWNPETHNTLKRKVRSILQRWFYNKADIHLTYSSSCSAKLVNIGFPEENIVIAYNGIEAAKSRLNKNTSELMLKYIDKGEKIFLYIGGLGRDKKVDLLLNAWMLFINQNNVKNVRLLIVGSGPEDMRLKAMSRENGIDSTVNFLGRIEDEKQLLFEAIHVLVLPGTGGLALNEAVLYKKPIIVSEADGTERDLVISGFNGLFFENGSISSLKSKLNAIYSNYDFFKSNSDALSDLVSKRSNVDEMVKTFKKTINTLK
jgi:glycosyltransferase involved in cell wall biosynthesis